MSDLIGRAGQMAVNAFWASVMKLEVASKSLRANLEANKLRLQRAYTEARQDPDPDRSTERRRLLDPMISENSRSRMKYRQLVSKFNEAVNKAREILRGAGLTIPDTLDGLGVAPLLIIVPAVAVTALGVAWAHYGSIAKSVSLQNKALDAALQISENPDAFSASDVRGARAAIMKQAGSQPRAAPDMFSNLVPLAAIIAIIVVGPSVIQAIKPLRRRAA